MRKTIFILLIMIVLFVSSIALVEAKEAPKFVLKYSIAAMPTVAHSKAIEVFAKEIEKLTNGQIKVETYYGGQLFSQEGQQNAVRRGALEMTNTGLNWLADHVPYLNMLAAPYFFKDYEHMTKVMNGDIGKEIANDVAKKTNVRMLSSWYMGTRQLNLRDIKKIVKTPDDMKGIKLRMPNSPSWLYMGKALGANPTPININELYMALKTGTVDGQENPLPNSIKRKFYEVTKYTILTGHYVNPIISVINEDKWQELGPELQEKMYAAEEKAREFCDSTIIKETKEGYDILKDKGMIFIEVDIDLWKEKVLGYYLADEKMTATWDMELYEKVQEAAQ